MKKRYLSLLPLLALVGCGANAGGVNTHVVVPTNGTVVPEENKEVAAYAMASGISAIGSNSFIATSDISLNADVSVKAEGESINAKIDLKAQTILVVDYLTVGLFEEYVIPSVSLFVDIDSLAVDVSYQGQKVSANMENLLVGVYFEASEKTVYVDLSGYGDEEFSFSANLNGAELDTQTVQALISDVVGDGLLYLDLSELVPPTEVSETVNIFEEAATMAGFLFASIVEEENFDIYSYSNGDIAASIDLKGEVEEGVNIQAGLMVVVNETEKEVLLSEVTSKLYVTAAVSDEMQTVNSNIFLDLDAKFSYDEDMVTAFRLSSEEKDSFTTDIFDLISAIE